MVFSCLIRIANLHKLKEVRKRHSANGTSLKARVITGNVVLNGSLKCSGTMVEIRLYVLVVENKQLNSLLLIISMEMVISIEGKSILTSTGG